MKKIVLLFLIATSVSSFGQATLVKDINQGNSGSEPKGEIEFNGFVYFSANDGVNGEELWRTDGTTAGTTLFKEFVAGSNNGLLDGNSGTFSGYVLNGFLYFMASDGATFNALWKTDGTVAGTIKVKSFQDAVPNFRASDLNNELVFSVKEGNDFSLWKSDGTEVGTTKLFDINPLELTNMGNEIFFYGYQSNSGTELWKTDGTVTGTIMVKDIKSGTQSSNPRDLRVINGNTLIFYNNNLQEVWKSDGTEAGTISVKNESYAIKNFTVFNNEVFFDHTIFAGGASVYSLWKTDGTDAGTVMVKDDLGQIDKIIVLNNKLYVFNASASFWITDGTESGTIKRNTVYTTFFGTNAKVVGTELLFPAQTDLGYELWKTDGTEAGTVMVKDIHPASEYHTISDMIAYNGGIIFTGNAGSATGKELWKSDGTEAGTVMVKDINQTGNNDAGIDGFFSIGSTVFFAADDAVNGKELWKTNGTTTSLFNDINIGDGFSSPSKFGSMNGLVYFYASTNDKGSELWKTDGTTVTMVKDINAGIESSILVGNMVEMTGNVYFFAMDGSGGHQLWKTDGTEAGTIKVKDVGQVRTGELTVFNNAMYFNTDDGTNGYEPWKSDGTEAGTTMLKNINPNTTPVWNTSSLPDNFIVFNNTLFFSAKNDTYGTELWKTDGTEAGTVVVKDIIAGNQGGSPSNLKIVGGNLFFSANNSTEGSELWKTDGTEVGTIMVKDINPGVSSSQPSFFTDHNGVLFFFAFTNNGYELWKSDGTEAGTVMVKDTNTGAASSATGGMISFGSTLIISLGDAYDNLELWKSDGTEAGTVIVQEINPSTSVGSSPSNFFINGSTLYFTADNGTVGKELWKIEQSALGIENVSKELTKVTIFPNPTNGVVSLKIENQEIQNVKVYSLFGKEVMRISSKNNTLIENINFQNLATGIYLLKIKTATNTFTRKIIKQ